MLRLKLVYLAFNLIVSLNRDYTQKARAYHDSERVPFVPLSVAALPLSTGEVLSAKVLSLLRGPTVSLVSPFEAPNTYVLFPSTLPPTK